MKKILVISLAILMLAVMAVPAFAADGDNVALDATVVAPYCSEWETPTALNDGAVEGVQYGSWGGCFANVETVSYEWAEPVTVDSIGVFFMTNVSHEDWVSGGGLYAPTSYTVQYKNEAGEYVDVANASGCGVELGVMNVTTFDAVTTTSIQISCVKFTEAELSSEAAAAEVASVQAWYDSEYPDEGLVATVDDILGYRGIGIFEIEVYEAGEETDTDTEVDTDTDTDTDTGTTTAPQTGVATVVLAVAAMLSGAYVVSKKR